MPKNLIQNDNVFFFWVVFFILKIIETQLLRNFKISIQIGQVIIYNVKNTWLFSIIYSIAIKYWVKVLLENAIVWLTIKKLGFPKTQLFCSKSWNLIRTNKGAFIMRIFILKWNQDYGNAYIWKEIFTSMWFTLINEELGLS